MSDKINVYYNPGSRSYTVYVNNRPVGTFLVDDPELPRIAGKDWYEKAHYADYFYMRMKRS